MPLPRASRCPVDRRARRAHRLVVAAALGALVAALMGQSTLQGRRALTRPLDGAIVRESVLAGPRAFRKYRTAGIARPRGLRMDS